MKFPRVTSHDLDKAICDVAYVVLPDNKTTICMLTLDNSFTVRGESSCVCPENFDLDVGQQIAFQNARDKLWPLLGFRLADKIAREASGPKFRSAESGEYVTEEYARAHPSTTVRED